MACQYHHIEVDEHGRSCIVAIHGDKEAEVGNYADGLREEDEVELTDGSVWTVYKVYSNIQTVSQGSGVSNYVYVDLVR